ncbi:hypothetical protein QTP86_013634, partial [Hemibagrus guttatus]
CAGPTDSPHQASSPFRHSKDAHDIKDRKEDNPPLQSPQSLVLERLRQSISNTARFNNLNSTCVDVKSDSLTQEMPSTQTLLATRKQTPSTTPKKAQTKAGTSGLKQTDIGVFFGLKPLKENKEEVSTTVEEKFQVSSASGKSSGTAERQNRRRKNKAVSEVTTTKEEAEEGVAQPTQAEGKRGARAWGRKRWNRTTATDGVAEVPKRCPFYKKIPGKGRELADMMERRKVDILCEQETRWKSSKARSIGAGFKLFYYGVDSKRNGVGVVLKEEFVRNVLEVKRVSDRVMSLKLETEGVMLNVVSGYAPQVGCELEEKERFWSELDEVMESIPTGERVVIGADFNGHVGEGNRGDEEVMGKFGVKERNLEGQMVVDFAKRMDMGVVNTYFQKREEHRVTYKSGGRRTQVDYILCRKGNLKEISDCKVVVGESVARRHRMVVCRMTLMVCKMKRSKIEIEKKTKWWKLKKEECCEEFRQKLRQALGGQVVLPDDWESTAEVIRETGRKVLGVSSGRRKEDKETWLWNEEVQDSIQRKRLAKKKWDMDRTEENRQEYKELQRRVKREVSKAKQKAYDELYTRLDTREGEKDLYRVLTSEESVQRRWKEYFEELMNEENEREKRVEGVNSVEQKVDKIRKDEVRKDLKRMKSGKAVGPDDIPVEVWKSLGEAAVEFLASLFNRVLESERMPEEWRRSVLVPIFKNKGDVQSCSNYRGIKLMSHTMKLWERVVEARLRKVVEICEQQYGFMPRKSTTDAIFALRILMEKYRDGQKELHCVFVDLEKAYDRVPREELWYCMRKSGVAEKYVRVVQDMYERSRTVVRCAVGQTEEFKVEVGLHQGSALSPFLCAMVMDQLSEEVRQESPWTMMFADGIVICSESREQVEENLERWRFALERRGMKVSRRSSFAVDAFQYGNIKGITAYFLTHFHSDHYEGLKKTSTFPIYCNKITGNLVKTKLHVDEQYIHILPMNEERVVDGVKVILLDANHCPGSAMLLLLLPDGQTVLHTGDFRAHPSMERYPELQSIRIQTIYLDTTYCSPEYTFPTQQEVITFAANTAFELVTLNPRTLVVCGSYSVGKEKVFLAISQVLGSKVYVSKDRYKTMCCLESEHVNQCITTNMKDSQIHVLPMMQVNFKNLKAYLNRFSGTYDQLVAFKPTGWTFSQEVGVENIQPQVNDNISIYGMPFIFQSFSVLAYYAHDLTDLPEYRFSGIPYSEHSSYLELKRFVQWLRPLKIIPTVNVGNWNSRKAMNNCF